MHDSIHVVVVNQAGADRRAPTWYVGRETAQGKRPVVSCLGPAKKLYRFEQNGYG